MKNKTILIGSAVLCTQIAALTSSDYAYAGLEDYAIIPFPDHHRTGFSTDEWKVLLSKYVGRSNHSIYDLVIFCPYPAFTGKHLLCKEACIIISGLIKGEIIFISSVEDILCAGKTWQEACNKTNFTGIIHPHLFIPAVYNDDFMENGLVYEMQKIKVEIEKKSPGCWLTNSFPVLGKHFDASLLMASLDIFLLKVDQIKLNLQNSAGHIHLIGQTVKLGSFLQNHIGLPVLRTDGLDKTSLSITIEKLLAAYLPGALLDKALILHPHSVSNNLLNKALERSLAKIYHSVLHWDSFEQFLNTQGLLSFRSATTRYFKGGLGENVIIIINALGLTIQFWESIVKLLIGKYKVIIWETRCCEIATGGMEKVVSIEQHVEDISGIIQAEGHQKYHLLAWCNGGRIAAVAASAMPDSICSVIYLCPAFRGMQGLAPIDSKFEKDLDEVFSAALREHKMAGFLSSYILKTNKGEPEYDPHQVLGLPNQDCREAIVAPMRTGEYLLNYAKRTQNDETFPLRKLIPGISQPTLFVLGSNDAVVSNDFLKSVIGLFKQATTYEILGASHYIQMQQPEILMDIIESFLGNQNPGTISVRAELLNQKQQLNDRKN